MRDLLSKEHYYYKIHTLLEKSSAYSTFLYELPPLFLDISRAPPSFLRFFKILNPLPYKQEVVKLCNVIQLM